jgi:hypothetical protein
MQSVGKGPNPVLALLIVACWLYVLVNRRAASDFFVAGVLVVLLLYPGFQDRLLVPVYVLVLASVVETLRDLFRRLIGARVAPAIVAAALLLLIAVDFKPRHAWAKIESRHRVYQQLCSIARGKAPPDVRLGAVTGWHLNVCLGRSVYGLKHTVIRTGEAGSVEQAIDKYDIDTVVLIEAFGFSDRDQTDSLLLSYFQENNHDIVKAGPMWFVKVRPRPGTEPPAGI